MSEPIIIVMDGGVIQDIQNIPPGVTIEVREYDFDVEEWLPGDTDLTDRLRTDDAGDEYILSVYEAAPEPAGPKPPDCDMVATSTEEDFDLDPNRVDLTE